MIATGPTPQSKILATPMVLNLLLQSRMPVVLARLRNGPLIDRNLCGTNEKNCLRMKESVGWTSSRLTIRLLNLKRTQLNRLVQVLTGHYNLLWHKKTTGCAKSSMYPKCSLENETPNHHVCNCKLYQDICVKYFGITKTTVYEVITKCNINKLAMYLKEAGRLSEFDK